MDAFSFYRTVQNHVHILKIGLNPFRISEIESNLMIIKCEIKSKNIPAIIDEKPYLKGNTGMRKSRAYYSYMHIHTILYIIFIPNWINFLGKIQIHIYK